MTKLGRRAIVATAAGASTLLLAGSIAWACTLTTFTVNPTASTAGVDAVTAAGYTDLNSPTGGAQKLTVDGVASETTTVAVVLDAGVGTVAGGGILENCSAGPHTISVTNNTFWTDSYTCS